MGRDEAAGQGAEGSFGSEADAGSCIEKATDAETISPEPTQQTTDKSKPAARSTDDTTRSDRTRGVGPRKAYSPPRLVKIAKADSLLEVLGPAQASYGGTGLV